MTDMFREVLTASFYAIIAGVAVIILKRLLEGKINAGWQYALWFLLLLKLIIPFGPESSFSLYGILPKGEWKEIGTDSSNMLPGDTENDEMQNRKSKQEAEQNQLTGELPLMLQETEPEHASQTETTGQLNNHKEAEEDIRQQETATAGLSIPEQELYDTENDGKGMGGALHTGMKIEDMMAYLWFIVMVLLFLWFVISQVVFRYNLRFAPAVSDHTLNRILEECGQVMKLKKLPSLIRYEQIGTPALFGLGKPKILIPSSALEMGEAAIRNIFLHELAHEKRKDIWMNYLLLILLCVHWFNPFLWYCFRFIRRDMELAADELAVSHLLPKEQMGYGETLLMIGEKHLVKGKKLSFSGLKMSDDKKSMEKRIQVIKNNQRFMKNRKIIACFGAVIILVMGTVLLTNAKAGQAEDVLTVYEGEAGKEHDGGFMQKAEDETDLPAKKEYLVQIKEDYVYSELYDAGDGKEGMYHVKQGNKYGYLNSYGEAVGEIAYDWSAIFNDGIGVVQKGEKWAAMSADGMLIRSKEPFFFDDFSYPVNGMLPVKVGNKWGILCADGHILGSDGEGFEGIRYDEIVNNSNEWSLIFQVRSNTEYGFLDDDGSIVGGQWFSCMSYMNENGTAGILYDENGDSIILKKDGSKISLPDGWYFAPHFVLFHDGYAKVCNGKGQFNFVNEKGELLCDLALDEVNEFYYGITMISINGKKGIMDTDGAIWGGADHVIYDEARPVISNMGGTIESRYAMVRMGSKWGVMDDQGNLLGGAGGICYDEISAGFFDGYIAVRIGNRIGFLGVDGKLLGGGLSYYEVIAQSGLSYWSSVFHDGMAAVSEEDGGFGYLKTDGTMLYEENPYRFQEAGDFKNGFAIVQINGGYGVIDKEGVEVLPPIYQSIRIGEAMGDEMTFFVMEGNLWGVVTVKRAVFRK